MKKNIISVLLTLAILYVWVSSVVFRLRHPWATETQVFLHMPDALKFNKIENENKYYNTINK